MGRSGPRLAAAPSETSAVRRSGPGPAAAGDPAAAPASLRRLRAFGVRPNRELGQHFLADANLLGVIARLAELAPDDVVLEIGGGLGALSEHLAPLVAHLHVVEVDRGLEAPLREALAGHPNCTLHLADALALDFGALDPTPTSVVANLPYGIASTVILRTIEQAPGVRRWVAMVQREVGERLAAAPGTRAYGVPSVLAQLACDVRVVRPVARTVFVPVPNVDSVLVRLDRRAPAASAPVNALVQAAFSHRRKALARSLVLTAPPSAPRDLRERAQAALEAMGHPRAERAERLTPAEFSELARRLEASR